MISKSRRKNDETGTAVRILDAAEQLFAQSGFAGTSTRAIAEIARANIGLLAYYFGSKEGLFEAVVSRRAQELIQELSQSINPTILPVPALRHFLAASATFLASKHRSFLLLVGRESLVSEPTALSEIVENGLDSHRRMLAATLNAGISEGVFRPLDPSLYYELVLASVAAVARIPDRSRGGSALEDVVDFLTVAVLRSPDDMADMEAATVFEVQTAITPQTPPPPSPENEDPFGIGIFD